MHWKILQYSQSRLITLFLSSIGATLLLIWVLTSDRMLAGKVNGNISFGGILLFAGFAITWWSLIVYQSWSRKGFLPGVADDNAGLAPRVKQVGRWYAAFTLGVFLLANLVIYFVSVWFLVSGIISAVGGSG